VQCVWHVFGDLSLASMAKLVWVCGVRSSVDHTWEIHIDNRHYLGEWLEAGF
jgi:hypothetical protein